MKSNLLETVVVCMLFLQACEIRLPENEISKTYSDTSYYRAEIDDNVAGDTLVGKEVLTPPNYTIDGGNGADTAHAKNIISFAKNFIGTPYKYASANPKEGFDCSGFLYYVFENFNIDVPRSSKDYMDFGTPIPWRQSKPGDFILFTGTDSTIRICGHVGLITENENNNLQFIHSSSGKAMGVTITGLNAYYNTRFLKCVRVLKNNY